MKLVLVSSPARESPEALPLGAASVAAAILAAGTATETATGTVPPRLASVKLALLEGRPGEGGEELVSRIASAEPDAVGLSVYSWNRELLAETARTLRAAMPGVIIFAGGPEVTADPGAFLLEAALDFAIAGEGETATVAALCALVGSAGGAFPGEALRRMPGLVLPLPSTLPSSPKYSASPHFPEDAASLPSPWLLGTIDPRGCGGDVIWELSRGCPFRCAYCYESKGSSGARPFPAQRIEAELELFVRSGVRYAFVLDPTFDSDPARAASLLELFRARAPGMRWKFEVRAELLDKALVRRFAALDCSLQIGLQSARAETLALVGRPGFDRREFARKAAMLRQADLSFGLDLIYGLPGDRLVDFEESVDFALGLGPNHLDLFPLSLLPGTELAERAVELGVSADPRPPYLVRSTRELPSSGLASAAELAAAADRFYTAGRAVAWFDAARKPLRLRPSTLLRGFSAYLAARGGSGKAESLVIEGEQLEFLEEAYGKAGLRSLLPALCDLVRLHGAWGRALAEGRESVLGLSYDPEEVLGSAYMGLAAFSRGAAPSRGVWRVLPDEEEGARLERSDKGRAP